MIKGFIFDFDGTLVDSMLMWHKIIREIIENKIKKLDDEEFFKIEQIIEPLENIEIAKFLINNYNLNQHPDEIVDEINFKVRENYLYHINYKKGTIEFLEKYKQKGIKMCICTASDKKIVEEFVKIKKLDKYIDFVISIYDVNKTKDFPDVYEKAVEMLELKKNQVVVFEDAIYAIKTLYDNNFNIVCIEDSTCKDKELAKKLSLQTLSNIMDYKEF